jgi:predicted RecA/RadA family phage recombinase
MTTYATFMQDGHSIDYTPSSDVLSGDVIVLGSLIGIATRPIPANTMGALAITGVFRIAKLSTDEVTTGAVLYWDDTNKYVTLNASGTTRIGLAVADSPSGQASADVLINS